MADSKARVLVGNVAAVAIDPAPIYRDCSIGGFEPGWEKPEVND